MDSEMDYEFKKVINEIKPLAKSLPRNSDERHYVTLWIKKLLLEENEKANRNHYSKMLLNSLKQSQLQPPFTSSPPELLLTTAENTSSPQYLGPAESYTHSTSGIYSLLDTPEKHSTPFRTYVQKARTITPASKRLFQKPHLSPIQPLSDSPKQRTSYRSLTYSSSSSSSPEDQRKHTLRRANSANVHILASSTSSDDGGKPFDMFLKDSYKLCKLYKNRSKIKQQNMFPFRSRSMSSGDYMTNSFSYDQTQNDQLNDERLKKLLHCKNNEIEVLRRDHSTECQKWTIKCQELEREVARLEKQCEMCRNEHEKELKYALKVSQKNEENLRANLENKFHAVLADMEQQKHELEQNHYHQMQSVIDDANSKILKMEGNYEAEKQTSHSIISDLKSKLVQLSQQIETANEKNVLEKNSLQEKYSSIESSYNLAAQRNEYLEEQCKVIATEKDFILQQTRDKLEQTINDLKQQNLLKESTSASKLFHAQQETIKLQEKLEETIAHCNQKMIEIEAKTSRQLHDQELEHAKQLEELQCVIKEKESDAAQNIIKFEVALKEKEFAMKEMMTKYDTQVKISEKAVENYKEKVELQMDKMFGEMRTEIERLEHELGESKNLRNKQEEEFQRKLSEETKKFTTQILKLTVECKQLEEEQTNNIEKINKQEIMIANLEQTIHDLKVKTETETTESIEQLTEKHKKEIAVLSERYSFQLQQLKHDHEVKTALSDENIVTLKSKIKSLEEDYERLHTQNEKEMKEMKLQNESELSELKLYYDAQEKMLALAAENERANNVELEDKLHKLQLTYHTQLSQLKSNQSHNLTGKTQKEYEHIIQFLNSQVDLLTQRTELLQKQLVQFKTCSALRKHMTTATGEQLRRTF